MQIENISVGLIDVTERRRSDFGDLEGLAEGIKRVGLLEPILVARGLNYQKEAHFIREHICIRRPEYVAGTATRPEVGVFTQTSVGRKPVPWGRIGTSETVWMKWSGGSVVAKSIVAGFRQFSDCSAADLRRAVAGFALYDLEDYWASRPPHFDAMAIYLKDEEWLDEPLAVGEAAVQVGLCSPVPQCERNG